MLVRGQVGLLFGVLLFGVNNRGSVRTMVVSVEGGGRVVVVVLWVSARELSWLGGCGLSCCELHGWCDSAEAAVGIEIFQVWEIQNL